MAFDEYDVPVRPMTSEEVFVALVALARISEPGGESMLDGASRDDSVKIIIAEFGAGRWSDAGMRLNELFGTQIEQDDWDDVFRPRKVKTVGGVCDLIAQHATVPVIQPVTVFGDRSLAAGAFLALRRIFADAGVNVANLRPSSPLRPYLCANAERVLPQLARVAPIELPLPRIDAPIQMALAWGIVASGAIAFGGRFVGVPPIATLGAGGFLILFWIAAWVCSRTVPPADIRFGDARTFRDLARIIAGERSAYQGFPVITR